MDKAGSIKDNTGKSYCIEYFASERLGRTHYTFELNDQEKTIGTFEFNVESDDTHARIDDSSLDAQYRRLGLYKAFLLFAADFFKEKGLKGIFSEGKLRNSMSNSAWNKIDVKVTTHGQDELGNMYNNHVLENILSYKEFLLTKH